MQEILDHDREETLTGNIQELFPDVSISAARRPDEPNDPETRTRVRPARVRPEIGR